MPNAMTVDALHFALDGVLQRQQVIASNIANSDVPGYQAQQVTFEASLSQALAGGGTATMAVVPEGLASSADGNNVSLPVEISAMEKNTLADQAVVAGLNSSFSMMSTAING